MKNRWDEEQMNGHWDEEQTNGNYPWNETNYSIKIRSPTDTELISRGILPTVKVMTNQGCFLEVVENRKLQGEEIICLPWLAPHESYTYWKLEKSCGYQTFLFDSELPMNYLHYLNCFSLIILTQYTVHWSDRGNEIFHIVWVGCWKVYICEQGWWNAHE